MKHARPFLLVSFLMMAAPLFAKETPANVTAPAKAIAVQAPDVAAPKIDPKTGEPQAAFMQAHERFLAVAKEGKAEVVFLGDSITAGWNGRKEIWERAFGKYQPANFGIGGDRTQHVLWRITNGELDGIKPKAVVIMIGTNNSGTDPAEGIAAGITQIVKTVRAKQPQAKILLLAVFPRGNKPGGEFGPAQEKLKQVNAIIAKLHDGKNVHFLDIGDKFVQGNGPIDKEIMPDFLHLSARGYEIWADAISPILGQLVH